MILQGYVVNVSSQINKNLYTTIENDKFCLNLCRECIAKTENKLLMCADVVCNTYFTRKTNKFSNHNISDIEKLYEKKFLIPSFTGNDTIPYLEHLLDNNNYSEIFLELISLKKNESTTKKEIKGLKNFIKNFVDKFNSTTTAEQKLNLDYISKKISLEDNLELILNYKNFVEKYFSQNNFLRFDSRFHLTTKYSHIGDIINANKTLKLCKTELSNLNKSWDKLSYYFNFNIREISLLIDMFKFEQALIEIEKFYNKIKIIYDTLNLQSDMFAKVLGVKVRIYLNLLRNHPE